MRILQTARWFFPHVGGASIRVYQTAKNLVKFGHEVHLLVHNPKSIEQCNLEQEAPSYEEYGGIHVYRLPYFGPNSLYWGLSIPLMAKKAIDVIKKERIDVILSHNPPYLVGTSSWIASKFTGVPIVLNVHDVWGASHYRKHEYIVGKYLEKFCCKRATRIITVSEGLADILSKETGIEKELIKAAPNAVDYEKFKPEKIKSEQFRRKYNLSRKKVVFFVGILRKWAGVQFLIKAFPEVLEKVPNSQLLIVGDGGDRKYLENLAREVDINEQTIFTGPVPYEDVPSLINLADVCVAPFPSSKVTDQRKLISPHKVLEYMCIGKPVVASRVGGMERYVKDGKSGLLFEPENVKDLADKIIILLGNKNLRETFGEQGKRLVMQEHTWEKTARIIEKTLKETLK